jgi:hypothetical protein
MADTTQTSQSIEQKNRPEQQKKVDKGINYSNMEKHYPNVKFQKPKIVDSTPKKKK